MRILGGSTTDTLELIFYSPNYVISAQYRDDKLNFNIDKHGISQYSKLGETPFLRGIYIYLSRFIGRSRIEFNLVQAIFFIGYIIDKFFLNVSLMDYIYVLFILSHLLVIRINKDMCELHGAEHMIGNYFDIHDSVTLENINEVKKCSILHERCSTNYLIFKVICILALRLIVGDFLIRFILTIALHYEFIQNRDDKMLYYLYYPLYALGKWTQKVFFVKQPRDKYIEMAIKTAMELEKYENKHIQ